MLIAAAFVFGAQTASTVSRITFDTVITPMGARAAIDAAVARHVLDNSGQVVVCRGPNRGWRDWQQTGGSRVCYSSEANLRVPLSTQAGETADNFRALAYTSAHNGEPYVVLSASANRLIRLHEGRHWSRRPLASATTSVDRIITHSYGESDAYLTEIVAAYQNYLQTGEIEEWGSINARAPFMVRVFDGLVAESPRAQAMLRRGELPPDRILQQTAASYLFSSGARTYLQNYYAEMYPDLQQQLASGVVNVTTRDLNNWLHFGNRRYLVTQQDQAYDPLSPWILHETLGLALPENLQPLADDYAAERARIRTQLERVEEGSAAHTALLESQEANERLSPTSRAWRAAGLEHFRETAPIMTRPAVPAPATRARVVVLNDEEQMAAITMQMDSTLPGPLPPGPLRSCNLFALAKIGRC